LEGAIQNGQTTKTSNIGTQDVENYIKTKQTTQYVVLYYTQTNTNNVTKTRNP